MNLFISRRKTDVELQIITTSVPSVGSTRRCIRQQNDSNYNTCNHPRSYYFQRDISLH